MDMQTGIDGETEIRLSLNKIDGISGAGMDLLHRVYDEVRVRSQLDPEVILFRLRWLLGRRDDGSGDLHKIDLVGRGLARTVEELSERVIHPKKTVFDFITANSSLSIEALNRIYETMLHSSTDSSGLPDLSEERTLQEIKWWILDLEFPEYYFETTPLEEIAHQILVNRFHEIQGMDSESYRNMKLSYTSPTGTAIHWVHNQQKFIEVEQDIEKEYYRTGMAHDVSVYAHGDLYLYIVQKSEVAPGADEFASSAPESFFLRNSEERVTRYRTMWEAIRRSGTFEVDYSRKEATSEYRLMIGFPARVVNHFMANLSRVLSRAGTAIGRKYIVAFSGAYPSIISSFYSRTPFPEDVLSQIVEIGLYPDTRLARLTELGVYAPSEANFIHAVIGYVHTFATVRDQNIAYLEERFQDHSELQELFVSVKRRMAKDTYTVEKIAETFNENPDVAKRLYSLFKLKLDPTSNGSSEDFAGSADSFAADLQNLIVSRESADVVQCALSFVKNTIRTNFFLPVKTALAFRLDPDFLRASDYGKTPYAVFYIRGRDFTGFHIRFGDIARGGIRILRSVDFDSFRANSNSLFEECYNLAATQDKKNKDIPEKGAKGVILPNFGKDDAAGRDDAFRKYVDALLDILLPENRDLIENYQEEILFLGPDEGTAEHMDWACERARARGYRYWKAFTTGKASYLGGISHVDYGMTTNGIHRYVVGILEKIGVREEDITKLQTGGPDGDLGGNEILVSKDRTICVVDGGGVVYDPAGLDRGELTRLACRRVDSSDFDVKLLGPGGFLVKVGDHNVTLPDGSFVQSGMSFRNGFHLSKWMTADLFVPCGGRPKSINSTNWEHLLDEKGEPRIRWIVEGANLFITQDARLRLEEKGVVLFKDSSTNKGGVTSSSYEVLIGLALPDDDFVHQMCTDSDSGVAADRIPDLRRRYIEEVIDRIKENADAEFGILWSTNRETGTPISELSDHLSARILEVTAGIENSTLFEDAELVSAVLRLHVPESLIARLGMSLLLEKVPRPYLKAIFARTIARRFVYEYGIEPSYESYRLFIEQLRATPAGRERRDDSNGN
ncbi:MAG TPA: NAD-glutamate dehydrogenase domain-containing protein [Spirochaetia bacterium]|nr:NAD-glutamate dehydrogenase domain-containing protein [Spirochaetia bacterium]